MKQQSRSIAIASFECLESGSTAPLGERVTPKLKAQIEKEIADMKNHGETVEFRNLCVRSLEFVLARKNPAEFSARVFMHAQRRILINGLPTQKDSDVMPFNILLNFVAQDERFKLDELDRG